MPHHTPEIHFAAYYYLFSWPDRSKYNIIQLKMQCSPFPIRVHACPFPLRHICSHHLSVPYSLLASAHFILHSIIPRLPHLRLEVQINQLVLLSRVFAVRVPVVHQLAAACIADLDSGVRELAVGGPFDLVAVVGDDREGLGAALVAVGVEAGLDGVVEDFAGGYGLGCEVLRGEGKNRLWNGRAYAWC